jgi:hypothetical protein
MVIFYTALLAATVYAFRCGGGPEKVVAALLLTAAALTLIVQSSGRLRFSEVELGVFLVDCGLLAGLLAVAMRAERYWPLWMTALQAVAVAGHGAKALNPHVVAWAYAVLLAVWGYPMVALLAVATSRHQHRVRKFGSELSWTRSSRLSRQPPADRLSD